MNVKFDSRPEHEERGSPRRVATLDSHVRCTKCRRDIESGDFALLLVGQSSFMCNTCRRSTRGKVNQVNGKKSIDGGTQRDSLFCEVQYFEESDRSEVRDEIVKEYSKEGYDMPSDDVIENMVDKRLESSSSKSDFEKESKPLSAVTH